MGEVRTSEFLPVPVFRPIEQPKKAPEPVPHTVVGQVIGQETNQLALWTEIQRILNQAPPKSFPLTTGMPLVTLSWPLDSPSLYLFIKIPQFHCLFKSLYGFSSVESSTVISHLPDSLQKRQSMP